MNRQPGGGKRGGQWRRDLVATGPGRGAYQCVDIGGLYLEIPVEPRDRGPGDIVENPVTPRVNKAAGPAPGICKEQRNAIGDENGQRQTGNLRHHAVR